MIISYNKLSLRLQPSRCLVRSLHRHFQWVRAAGGVVEDAPGRLLIIVREGRWDLPKGMVEPGETLRQAALREVQEETGLQHLEADTLLLKTYHIYDKYGGWHLKQTSWYRMRCTKASPTLPQSEEGITQVLWLNPSEWCQRLQHSFASMKQIVRKMNSYK